MVDSFTFDECEAQTMVQYVKTDAGATPPQVAENVSVGCDQTARVGRRGLYGKGHYHRVSVHKCLITKMNSHLRVQWCNNHIDTGLSDYI